MQTFFYYQTYPDDNIFLKLPVYDFYIITEVIEKLSVLCQVAMIWYQVIVHTLCTLFSFYSRILETIQSGLTISFNNTYLIEGFGDVSALAYISWYAPSPCQLPFP